MTLMEAVLAIILGLTLIYTASLARRIAALERETWYR
jgi:hypothetical protein